MVKTWITRFWDWLSNFLFPQKLTPAVIETDLTGKPFKYARILKSSRGLVPYPTWPEGRVTWNKSEKQGAELPESGLPGCKHVRSVPNGLPPELYS